MTTPLSKTQSHRPSMGGATFISYWKLALYLLTEFALYFVAI